MDSRKVLVYYKYSVNYFELYIYIYIYIYIFSHIRNFMHPIDFIFLKEKLGH